MPNTQKDQSEDISTLTYWTNERSMWNKEPQLKPQNNVTSGARIIAHQGLYFHNEKMDAKALCHFCTSVPIIDKKRTH